MPLAHGSGIAHVVNTQECRLVRRFISEHCVLEEGSAVIHILYISPLELMFPVQFKHKLGTPASTARARLTLLLFCVCFIPH